MNMITENDPAEYIVPLVEDVVSGFISHPDKLEVEVTRVGTILDLRLVAHTDDYPKIVGKTGRNIASLNELFGTIGRRFGLSVVIGVPDRTERTHPANKGFVNNPDWPRADFINLLMDVLNSLCEEPPRIREQIHPSRRYKIGDNDVVMDESSVFSIKAERGDLTVFRREIEIALEVLFRAIGQQQGRRVNLSFTNVGTGEQTKGRAETQSPDPPVESARRSTAKTPRLQLSRNRRKD